MYVFVSAAQSSSEAYLELTDLGGFLSKYIFIMLDKDKQNMVSKQEYLKLVNHFREEKTTEEELDLFLNRHLPEGQSADCKFNDDHDHSIALCIIAIKKREKSASFFFLSLSVMFWDFFRKRNLFFIIYICIFLSV